ncbi:MAG: glycosyltransferase 87 family protein [Pseudomonadota bacterium]
MRSSRPADRTGVALALLLGLSAFLLSWALLHTGRWQRGELVDTGVYERYGDAIVRGEVPYRAFVPEYPPLALPAFVLPSLVVGADASQSRYEVAFDLLMLACGLALVVLVGLALAALGAPTPQLAAALALVGLAPLLLGSVVLTRYDLWPAALTAGAMLAFVRGRDRLGAGVLGAAAAAKAYPVVLVPIAAAWVWRRRGRSEAILCGAVFAAVVAACVLPFLVVAPEGVRESVERQLERPLQIESLAAAALVAAGADVSLDQSHGSQNVGGGLGDAAAFATTAAMLGALVSIWVAAVRGPAEPERLVRLSAAAVVAAVALGKVLSPQFLVWLVPLVPLVAGRRGLRASVLLAAALVLTQLWFPTRYWDYALGHDRGLALVVLARDLVLVALLVTLVLPASDAERRPRA